MKRLLLTLMMMVVCAVCAPGAGVRAQGGSDEDQAPAAQMLDSADREFARESYGSAERMYRKAIEAQPDNTHALGRLALLLTWRGQYKEAIDLYGRAHGLEPGNLETRRGLATALAWSEDYPKALRLYEDLLQETPGDEGLLFQKAQAEAWSGDLKGAGRTLDDLVGRNRRHLKARVLMGQVRQWSGDPTAAEKIFRAVLMEDQANAGAEAGLCESLNTQGKASEALGHCDRALSLDPKNRTALAGRAAALQSQGKTPEALDTIRRTLELYPDARDARRLGREIGGPLRPTMQLFGTTVQDNENNDLSTWGGTYTHFLDGHGYVGLTFTHAQTDALIDTDPNGTPVPSATPVARYDTLRLIGGWHVVRAFSVYLEAGGETTSFPFPEDPDPNAPSQFLNIQGAGATTDSVSHAAGALTFEVNAGEWFTLIGSASQDRLVGTTQAFMNDVGIRAATLTTIFRPHRLVRLRLTGQKARFTDDDSYDVDSSFRVRPDNGRDNARDLFTAGATWRLPLKRPIVSVSYAFRTMSYDHDLNQGYFDPDRFRSHIGGLDISDAIGHHFYWGGGFDGGVQHINDLRQHSVLGYRVLAGARIGETASIEAYYARSDLALASAAGYKSSEGGIRLKVSFGGSMGPASPGRDGSSIRGGTSD